MKASKSFPPTSAWLGSCLRRTRSLLTILPLTTAGCGSHAAPERATLIAFSDFGCPRVLEDSGYSVEARLAADYTICDLKPMDQTSLPAGLLVGGHWRLPENSRFAGFSDTPAGPIAWFHGVASDATPVRTAFIPTGLDHPSAVMLTIRGGTRQDANEQRDRLLAAVVKAAMLPDNALKPTPSPRRD